MVGEDKSSFKYQLLKNITSTALQFDMLHNLLNRKAQLLLLQKSTQKEGIK